MKYINKIKNELFCDSNKGNRIYIARYIFCKNSIKCSKRYKSQCKFIGAILLIIGLVICYHISNEKQKEKKNRIIRAIVGIGILFVITNVPYLEEVGIWDVNDCYKCHINNM